MSPSKPFPLQTVSYQGLGTANETKDMSRKSQCRPTQHQSFWYHWAKRRCQSNYAMHRGVHLQPEFRYRNEACKSLRQGHRTQRMCTPAAVFFHWYFLMCLPQNTHSAVNIMSTQLLSTSVFTKLSLAVTFQECLMYYSAPVSEWPSP